MFDIANVVLSLRELADKELQSKLWLGLVEGEASFFEEAVEQLVTDSRLGQASDHGYVRQAFSDDLNAAIVGLLSKIKSAPDDRFGIAFIESDYMSQVREMSAETLKIMKRDIDALFDGKIS